MSSGECSTVRQYILATSKSWPPHTLLRMPALSPTMTSGNLAKWLKKPGEQVEIGDVLCEIETDKATMDFESPEEGYVAKQFVEDGEKGVEVGRPLVVIVEDQGDVGRMSDFTPEGKKEVEVAPPEERTKIPSSTVGYGTSSSSPQAPTKAEVKVSSHVAREEPHKENSTERIFASPAARFTAKERGIELEDIKGTGPGHRITKADVLQYKPETKTTQFVDVPITGMRKTIAERLVFSKTTIPHFHLTVTINISAVQRIRQLEQVSINDIVIKAAAMTCKRIPEVNSSWQETHIRQFNQVDVCVAVSTPNGLLTPIVFDASNKGIKRISQDVKELAVRAREGKLRPEEYQGGTFTISNLGMLGIESFTAVINPPQAAILSVGAVNAENLMHATLGCDHRVIDGAKGAEWLIHFKRFLEEPALMLFE